MNRRDFLPMVAALIVFNTATAGIVTENRKPGSVGWKTNSPVTESAPEIMGYANSTSVNRGGRIAFKVSLARAGTFEIDFYRLGHYQGKGGRLVASSGALSGGPQRECAPTSATVVRIQCKWNTSYLLRVGRSWQSGLYFAKFIDRRSGKESATWFVVRNDASRADILFQSSFSTFQAYNNCCGRVRSSTYSFNSDKVSREVSSDRPFGQTTIAQGLYDNPLMWEHSMIRWLEKRGYDVTYITTQDTHQRPGKLERHKIFMSVGHDEYWSTRMRNGVESALQSGVNIVFASANTAYWKSSFHNNASVIRVNKPRDTWRNLGHPENALLGVMYTGDQSYDKWGGAAFCVKNSRDPYYAGTGLRDGDCLPGLVGFEWDSLVPNGRQPRNIVVLGESPVQRTDGPPASSFPPGADLNVSHAVRYIAPSGGKVFSTGTIQWAWGLDDAVVPGWAGKRADPRLQRMFSNALADMGAMPK